MVSEAELRRWRRYRKQSRDRLWPGAVFGGLATLALVVIRLLVGDRFPGWLLLVGLAAVWFQFLGDWINVRYLDRRIATAERERGPG